MNRILPIVLTGGPGGGKTTLMNELRAEDPHGKKWILVPEAAPLLFRAWLDGRTKSFQRAVVRLQIALEEACATAAASRKILLCHRGTLDPLAYWLRNGWDENEFFDYIGMTREEHHQRYFGVIHLQTAAIGAEAYYRRWPDAHRPETVIHAAEIDSLCAHAWQKHHRYVLINNVNNNWPNKARIARDLIIGWLTSASK